MSDGGVRLDKAGVRDDQGRAKDPRQMSTRDYVEKWVYGASELECVFAQRAGRGQKSLSHYLVIRKS